MCLLCYHLSLRPWYHHASSYATDMHTTEPDLIYAKKFNTQAVICFVENSYLHRVTCWKLNSGQDGLQCCIYLTQCFLINIESMLLSCPQQS